MYVTFLFSYQHQHSSIFLIFLLDHGNGNTFISIFFFPLFIHNNILSSYTPYFGHNTANGIDVGNHDSFFVFGVTIVSMHLLRYHGPLAFFLHPCIYPPRKYIYGSGLCWEKVCLSKGSVHVTASASGVGLVSRYGGYLSTKEERTYIRPRGQCIYRG